MQGPSWQRPGQSRIHLEDLITLALPPRSLDPVNNALQLVSSFLYADLRVEHVRALHRVGYHAKGLLYPRKIGVVSAFVDQTTPLVPRFSRLAAETWIDGIQTVRLKRFGETLLSRALSWDDELSHQRSEKSSFEGLDVTDLSISCSRKQRHAMERKR